MRISDWSSDVCSSDLDMKTLYRAAVNNIDRARGQVFNIGGGVSNSLSLLELFAHLEKNYDVKLDYTREAPRERDQRVFISDLRKRTAERSVGTECDSTCR